MKKVKRFWTQNVNIITMKRKPKLPKRPKNEDHSVESEIRKKDQASIFKPKGFR